MNIQTQLGASRHPPAIMVGGFGQSWAWTLPFTKLLNVCHKAFPSITHFSSYLEQCMCSPCMNLSQPGPLDAGGQCMAQPCSFWPVWGLSCWGYLCPLQRSNAMQRRNLVFIQAVFTIYMLLPNCTPKSCLAAPRAELWSRQSTAGARGALTKPSAPGVITKI